MANEGRGGEGIGGTVVKGMGRCGRGLEMCRKGLGRLWRRGEGGWGKGNEGDEVQQDACPHHLPKGQ